MNARIEYLIQKLSWVFSLITLNGEKGSETMEWMQQKKQQTRHVSLNLQLVV